MTTLKKQWKRIVLFSAIGVTGGYAYYYFFGCTGGSCPITGNPYLSTLWGGLIGTLVGWREKPKTNDTESLRGGGM
ncbi:MAG TPA: hypothetical protein VGB38_05875 [bacterium]